MTRFFRLFLVLVLINVTGINPVKAQETKPGMAFLKSLVVPGWGHLSLGGEHTTRGYIHLGTDVALILTYFGVDLSAQHLQQNMYSFVELNANTTIKNRERGFRLAIGQFENLATYNDYQERNRNWNSLFSSTPSNQWQWNSVKNQANYIKMRNDIDSYNQQLPFILSAMVANRLISGISAFIRAREMEAPKTSLSFTPVQFSGNVSGLALSVRTSFN